MNIEELEQEPLSEVIRLSKDLKATLPALWMFSAPPPTHACPVCATNRPGCPLCAGDPGRPVSDPEQEWFGAWAERNPGLATIIFLHWPATRSQLRKAATGTGRHVKRNSNGHFIKG